MLVVLLLKTSRGEMNNAGILNPLKITAEAICRLVRILGFYEDNYECAKKFKIYFERNDQYLDTIHW